MNELLFLDPREIETGFLSNFFRSEFLLDDALWPTVEHYYQAQKFTDAADVEHIRMAATPRAAKNLGQTRDVPVRADWDIHRMTAMLRALVSKFTQHHSLQQKLLATGDAMLVEASPHDRFWGDGPDRQGQNRLGYLLTSLRDQLRMALAQVDGISADPEALAQQCFEAVRTLHVTWWLPDNLRTEAQTEVLPDHLYAYVRDVDLPDGHLQRYRPGLIFREPTFCDASEHSKEGLAAKHRYFLLSGNARHLDSFFGGKSGSPGTGLCMFIPPTLWKVLAVHHAEGYAQITLLEIPPAALHAFNCQALTVLEKGLADKAAEQFSQALQRPALDACKGADWLKRLHRPLGIDENGVFLECWFNGCVTRNLRADGRMRGGSLGEDMDQPEAIEQAKLREVMLLINEREQEEGLVHRLFQSPMTDEEVALAKDYILFTASLPMEPGSIVPVQADAVYAPFNQNTYLCTFKGWRYVGSFPTQEEAAAALAPWCQAQNAHPCREVHRKFVAVSPSSAAGGGSDAKLTRSQRFWASLRTELFVLVFLAALVGLCWVWYRAVETWPWVLPGLCAVIFFGGCVALWMQRREKKRLQAGDSGSP